MTPFKSAPWDKLFPGPKVLMVITVILLMGCSSSSWTWTKQNTALEVVATGLHVADWMQTRYIAAHPDRFYEINPLIGKHPSDGQVNTYFALSHAGAMLATVLMPNPYRMWFQSLRIGVSGYLVSFNASKGIGMRW